MYISQWRQVSRYDLTKRSIGSGTQRGIRVDPGPDRFCTTNLEASLHLSISKSPVWIRRWRGKILPPQIPTVASSCGLDGIV